MRLVYLPGGGVLRGAALALLPQPAHVRCPQCWGPGGAWTYWPSLDVGDEIQDPTLQPVVACRAHLPAVAHMLLRLDASEA